ncbi:hypothetical protein, partial [Neisseria sicca]|uniref:hypothetical protein n=1 Tax=Neisseria sicca TaxID=490 RepID=UPI00164A0A70
EELVGGGIGIEDIGGFEGGVDGVDVEWGVGKERGLFLFVFEMGGGVFEFFGQHGEWGLELGGFVGDELGGEGLVYGLVGEWVFEG